MDGHDITWWELADSVYLASVMRSGGQSRVSPHEDDPEDALPPARREIPWRGPPDSVEPLSGPAANAEVAAVSPGETEVRVPLGRLPERSGPAAIPGWSAMTRALRPLKRTVRSWHEEVFDEEATAERAVQDGLWWPVTRPATQRWLDLTVVVDSSPSMSLWRAEVAAFVALLEQVGAFRTVQVRLLVRRYAADGSPAEPVLRGATPATATRSPAELLDPSGRRVVLVVTDGVDDLWRHGKAGPMLTMLGRVMPVAVVNLLPQRLWGRTGLTVERVRLGASVPVQANRAWQMERPDAWLDPGFRDVPDEAVPIPVLELAPRWLRLWVRLITRPDVDLVDAPVLLTTSRPPMSDLDRPYEGSESDRVRQFRATASPEAARLASLLAAVPVRVDTARVVQAVFLPESGPEHLAEVLTSGLLRPADGNSSTWDDVEFVIGPQVRQLLLGDARRSDIVRVVRVVAARVADPKGTVGRLRDAISMPHSTPDPVRATDVSLERAVMRALGGPYLARADRLVGEDQPFAGQAVADVAWRRTEHDASRPAQGEPDIPLVAPLQESRAEGIPKVWGNVPPRNPDFVGREDLLERLRSRMRAGDVTAVLPEALHGMGGIGKSQIAVEYVYRYLPDYDLVWWIPAAGPTQIRAGLTELAKTLGLPEHGGEPHTAVPAVYEALRRGRPIRRWLMVFDSGDTPDDVRPFIPAGGSGEVLVTSRNADWASTAGVVEVPLFDRAESIELLRRRAPMIDEHDADRLADMLGDLPLAVEQAAAWLRETGMPVSDYMRLFEEHVAVVLDAPDLPGYPISVAAAWDLSFDELRKGSPAAHELLQVCAFFAPEPISRSLFMGGRGVSIAAELDIALRDPIKLNRAIREINRFSLAKIDHRDDTILLHRLVQQVLRGRMSPERQDEMRHGAHMLLAFHDPNDPVPPTHSATYLQMVPHVLASDLVSCDNKWARQLVINLSLFLYRWGDHHEGAELARRALETWTERSGETDRFTLLAASALGRQLWAAGRYTEAATINLRTYELHRQVSGMDNEDTVLAALRVAADIRASGGYAAARAMNAGILDTTRSEYGEDDPITLEAAHDLGTVTRLCGDYRGALALAEATYKRRREVSGDDHVDTLDACSAMGVAHSELGDHATAQSILEKVVSRLNSVFGENNIGTLRRLSDLAVVLRRVGDHASAAEMSARAGRLLSQRYGEDNPDALVCALVHSVNLRHFGDLTAARELGADVLARYRNALGERHPHSLASAVDLAVTLRLSGNPASARDLAEQSFARFRELLGDDHPHSMVSAIELASDLAALGAADAARELGSDTVERAGRVLGVDHPITLAAKRNLAVDDSTAATDSRADCDIDLMPG